MQESVSDGNLMDKSLYHFFKEGRKLREVIDLPSVVNVKRVGFSKLVVTHSIPYSSISGAGFLFTKNIEQTHWVKESVLHRYCAALSSTTGIALTALLEGTTLSSRDGRSLGLSDEKYFVFTCSFNIGGFSDVMVGEAVNSLKPLLSAIIELDRNGKLLIFQEPINPVRNDDLLSQWFYRGLGYRLR